MELRLSGVDTSLGGLEQALSELEAATNCMSSPSINMRFYIVRC